MSLSGSLALHKAEVEQRLTDLASKAEHLARVSGKAPLNWHEFQNANEELRKYSSEKKFSSDGSNFGLFLGLIGGLAAATFLVSGPFLSPVIPLAGAIGGGLVGYTLGGLYPSGTDHREKTVDAYARYLDDFPHQNRHGPATAVQVDVRAPKTPVSGPSQSQAR